MNKIFNKLFLGLAVCGLAMTACSDGVEWEPSPVPTEGVQAYIYADNTDLTYYPNDEQFFVVQNRPSENRCGCIYPLDYRCRERNSADNG